MLLNEIRHLCYQSCLYRRMIRRGLELKDGAGLCLLTATWRSSFSLLKALYAKIKVPKVERYPFSIDRIKNNYWAVDDYIGKYEHLLRSGQLGMCDYRYCTTCPLEILDAKSHMNRPPGDAKCWAKRMWSCLRPYILGVVNPHAKFVLHWKKFILFSCSIANFLDPLFLFLFYVQQNNKCIALNWPMTKAIVILRSITDFIYLLHIILQFRLAYVAPESTGDLVDKPKMIARNYVFGHFIIIDLFVVLPLPQIIILFILSDCIGASGANYAGANYAKILLPLAIPVQLVPRLYRLKHLVAGSTPTGFIFDSAWSNIVLNLLTFVLASHVVGSCWYLFGLQRVNQCFRDACGIIIKNITRCMEYMDCGHGDDYGRRFGNDSTWEDWKKNEYTTACFGKDGFEYGIYQTAVNLTTHKSIITRYVYSLFWGFQQISTLAGNQEPSYFVWEVLFTMFIVGVGLLLFALLIGNIQNYLQDLGRRKFEMFLRRRDVEQWMNRCCLPKNLRRKVRDSERFNWTATRGVNEEFLMENLPEDLQRQIRRHLSDFFKGVLKLRKLDEAIIDAIREKLKIKTYIQGSRIWDIGDVVGKMVFIIRGEIKISTGEVNKDICLSEGDICGYKLLTWCYSSVNKEGKRIRNRKDRLLSQEVASCLSNVEAFVLQAADLEEVISLFQQDARRYELPSSPGLAAIRIQAAWRSRMTRINQADSSSPPRN